MMLTENIQIYLEDLTEKYDSISTIWLIGSRANGCAHEHSDWDFLVFANNDTLQSLCCDPMFKQNDIDLLVVYDGDSFRKPWTDDDGLKRGSLEKWKWSEKSKNEAEYTQLKWLKDEDYTNKFEDECVLEHGEFVENEVKGILVWKKTIGFVLQ